jgi:hypothetical protein
VPPLLSNLLRAAVRDDSRLAAGTLNDSDVDWAVTAGLGALLFYHLGDAQNARNSPHWQSLQSADLTAKFAHGEHIDALVEIIDSLTEETIDLTLLKGMSISGQYYPRPHWRSMGDIDVLVRRRELPVLNALLTTLGYQQRSAHNTDFYRRHHHDIPWYHAQKEIWVEVHTGLFPAGTSLGQLEIFNPPHIENELRVSTFSGRSVLRLSDELQLVYIAGHWGQELNCYRGVFGLLDIAYLLKARLDYLDWNKISAWVGESIAATYLRVVLSYIHESRILNLDKVPRCLRDSGQNLGSVNLRIAHYLVSRCLLQGKIPKSRIGIRNLDILWKTLVGNSRPAHKPLLLLRNLFLPFRIRESILK